MSVAPSTQFARDIIEELRTITKANGYLTDLGLSAHRGYYAHVLGERDTLFPAVILHPGPEEPRSAHGRGLQASVRYSKPIVIAVEVGNDEEAYDALEACSFDVRRALSRARDKFDSVGAGEDFEIGTTEPDLSVDSRFALAAMQVSISVIEHYEGAS